MEKKSDKREIPIKDASADEAANNEQEKSGEESKPVEQKPVIDKSTATKAYQQQASESAEKPEEQSAEQEKQEVPRKEAMAAKADKTKELQDKLLRLHAEFENFRRRTEKERRNLIGRATSDLVHDLLPVIDNFNFALSHENSDLESFRTGIEMIQKQLMEALSKHGLEKIDAVGTHFDPTQHEALMSEPSDEYEDGIVMQELQAGFKMKGTVIRPTRVKVSSGTPDLEEKE